MRVLYLFCDRFGLETFRKGTPEAEDDERKVEHTGAVVCLVHSEEHDDNGTVTKLIKHAKWVARKFESKRIVLHFFAHLGEDRGDPDDARALLKTARDRLAAADYDVDLMPFGYFCKLDFSVHGESMAKIFRVF